jgi:MFS family permease
MTKTSSILPVDFKKLMAARFLFTFAVQMQAVVLGWKMYDLTHDPLCLGLIGLAEAVPALGLALFAGQIVDNGRPLVIYRYTIFISFLSAMIMLISQVAFFDFSTIVQIFALYASSFLTGVSRSFSQPTIFASVPRIVPRSLLPQASASMSTSMQIARIAGPALGGILFGWMGALFTSNLVCLGILLALISAIMIKINLEKLVPAEQVEVGGIPAKKLSRKEELLSGAYFVFRHPILFPALTLDMVSVLFGGVTALLPIFAAEILMIGPKGLGVLRASPALGATMMSLWLTRRNFKERAGTWLLSSVFGFGVCILVFGLSSNFYLSLIALGLSGAFDSVSMVIRTTAVQLASPDSLRGRISAVNSIFIGSSNELGELESGIAAKLLGAVNSVIFGGIMCIGTVLFMARTSVALRKLNLEELSVVGAEVKL